MVVNDHFVREGHLWQPSPQPGQVVTSHLIAWKVISKLNWTKILVYSSALQCKKVQSSTEKFHRLKKLRKTENFSFNLNIRVPIQSVDLFLDVFLCLKVILTMEYYMKLLIIFIWKFAIFWSWQLALWNLGQLFFHNYKVPQSPPVIRTCWHGYRFGRRGNGALDGAQYY